jgi:hypothetical protein
MIFRPGARCAWAENTHALFAAALEAWPWAVRIWRMIVGLLAGGATFRRFSVPTQLPEGLLDSRLERIQRYAFRELTAEDEDRPSAGWALIASPLETEFSEAECIFDHYVGLAYRVEKRTVQPLRLQGEMRRAEARILEEEEVESLPRGRLRELKETVAHMLLAQTTPRISICEVIWAVDQGLLLIGTAATHLCAEIREHFERTFELEALPLFPYALAGRIGISQGAATHIDAISETILVPEMAARIRAAAAAAELPIVGEES